MENSKGNRELDKEVVVAEIATTTQHGAMKGKEQTHIVDFLL